MARAIVGHRIIAFAGGFHRGKRVGNRGVNAGVVAGIKAVHRSFNARHGIFLRRAAVKHESRRQIRAVGGKAEALAAAPAEARDKQLAA